MPTVSKSPKSPKTATPKKAAKKVIVRKAAKTATPKAAKTAKAAPAKKAESTWVTQSTVAFSEEIGASRFTTQTQRRLLREIVASKSGMSFSDAKAPTLRSIDRLKTLGLVTVAKNGTAKATKRGADLVA